MSFSWEFPYPSQRMPVFAANVVATSQPLAAQAGLQMLAKGGNAVDAALATAIALAIVEPTSNGIGSDAFALIWDGTRLHGLNGSGRSPRTLSADRFAGMEAMPMFGWDAVTVPGAVESWVRLSERFGKLPFESLFSPAIEYARNGYQVSPITAARWHEAQPLYTDFPDFAKTFLPSGRAPHPGELFKCPDQADTLEKIAASKGNSFYSGELAERIVQCSSSAGGAMELEDLAGHQSDWVDPIFADYRGYRLYEIPPNGQGLAALIALGILRNHDISKYPVDSPDSIHLQIEAMKIGFAEAHRHIADPENMAVSIRQLLDRDFLISRSGEIRMDSAGTYASKIPNRGGTVYLAAADAEGMMVSMIQSNYCGFGSGVVIPGTGISMQNRGFGFVLEKDHPNCVAGGKRPYHTIIPGFVMQNGKPLMCLGVMGGHMQPQGHVQMMVRMFDYNQNPQTACDAPRWFITEEHDIALEPGLGSKISAELRSRGHRIVEDTPTHIFGGAQLIYRMQQGYCAASEPRKDGHAVGY